MTQVKIPAGTIVDVAGEVCTALKDDFELRHSINAALVYKDYKNRFVKVNIHGVYFVIFNCRVVNGCVTQDKES